MLNLTCSFNICQYSLRYIRTGCIAVHTLCELCQIILLQPVICVANLIGTRLPGSYSWWGNHCYLLFLTQFPVCFECFLRWLIESKLFVSKEKNIINLHWATKKNCCLWSDLSTLCKGVIELAWSIKHIIVIS